MSTMQLPRLHDKDDQLTLPLLPLLSLPVELPPSMTVPEGEAWTTDVMVAITTPPVESMEVEVKT